VEYWGLEYGALGSDFKGVWVFGMHVSPRAKWNVIQIFFRTIWTLLKGAEVSNGQQSSQCQNCFHSPADTLHIYTQCSVANRIWHKVSEIIRVVKKRNQQWVITPCQILFHKNIRDDKVIIPLILAGKNAITNIARKVHSKPTNKWVVNAFLRTEIDLLCGVHMYLIEDTGIWCEIKYQSDYFLNTSHQRV
jgi:hypothetical protein